MADMDREMPERSRVDRHDTYMVERSGTSGWWIAGLLVLAVMIIGFMALSGGNPAPVEAESVGMETPAEPGVIPLNESGL